MIGKGRYINLERNKRLCPMCNFNYIEDEYHFILRWPAYNDLRKNTWNTDTALYHMFSN